MWVSLRHMKKTYSQLTKRTALSFLLSGVGLILASAAPESQVYSPGEIHHYAANGGDATVTTRVPSHYRFQNGKYVWIPTYEAEAPLPKGPYTSAIWISPSSSAPGHWSARSAGQ